MGILDRFKRNKGLPAFESGDVAAEDLPDLEQQEAPSLAESAQRSRRQAREAEKVVPQAAPAHDENEGLPSVNRRRGGSKLINIIGLFVIVGVGVAMLVAVNGKKGPPKAKKAATQERVENNLPPLVVAPPAPPPPPPPASAPAASPSVPAIAGAHAAPGTTAPIGVAGGARPQQGGPNAVPLDWADRKRGGGLLVKEESAGDGAGASPVQPNPYAQAALVGATQATGTLVDGGGNRSELGARLEATPVKPTSAAFLPDRNFLIAKGTPLDCVLDTAIDSTVPGLTTCVMSRDVYSDNGQVLLLDRGTQIVGEYQGGVKQGQARIFVLWTRAKTPNGVVITLNSPGTDALGRSGLDGWVDNHYGQRFAAAILTSMIKDGLIYAASRGQSGSGGNTVVYGNTQQTGEQLSAKILDSTANIPPTLFKNQGDHIQVMVARDLDFSAVYALKVKQ